jgi:hypothetical protein
MSFRALRELNSVLSGEPDPPLFEHGRLDYVIAALDFFRTETTQKLVARRLLEILESPCSENWKTIAARIARRYLPLHELVTSGPGWPSVQKNAILTTIGSDENRCMVRYVVAYPGAMRLEDPMTREVYHSAEMVEEIYTTGLDASRREAIYAAGLRDSRNNPPRFRAMFKRKSTNPPREEEGLRVWHGTLDKITFP